MVCIGGSCDNSSVSVHNRRRVEKRRRGSETVSVTRRPGLTLGYPGNPGSLKSPSLRVRDYGHVEGSKIRRTLTILVLIKFFTIGLHEVSFYSHFNTIRNVYDDRLSFF